MRPPIQATSFVIAEGMTMKRRLMKSLLAAACVSAPLAGFAVPAQAQAVTKPTNEMVLSIGRGQLVTLPAPVRDLFIVDDNVVDVQVKSERQLYVFGKAGGETTIYASDARGHVIWSTVARVGSNIESVDQMLRLAMPEAKIAVSTMGTGTVLLTGTVAAPEDAAEAQRLVTAYLGEKANVISRLRMATPLQVNLQVRIAEVSRSLVRDMGVNLKTADSTGGFKFGIGQGRVFSPQWNPGGPMGVGTTGAAGVTVVTPAEVGSSLFGAGKLFGLDILGALDLGETIGLATTLAQPNLTALSGETADFLAGGEFAIPSVGGLGATSIEWKKYGISLAYTPTVLANGRISLRVRPEVSELSAQGAVTFGGVQVPALTVRRAETTVELGSGQSFMIAGLLSNNAQNTLKRTPGAADVPILGNLFKSSNFRKGETELVIVVTPFLVNPVNANDIKLPTDGFNTATEIDRLLANKFSDGRSGQDRPKPSMAPDRTAPAPNAGPGVSVAPDADAAVPAAPQARNDSHAKRNARKSDIRPGFSLQ